MITQDETSDLPPAPNAALDKTATGTTDDRPPRQSGQSAESSGSAQELSCIAYAGFYLLLFFAYWFGSSRFDVDGDGDFDPSDVQAYLVDHSVLAKNYRKKPDKKAKSARISATKAKLEAAKQRASQEQPQPLPKPKWYEIWKRLDANGDGQVDIDDFAAEVDGDAIEDEMIESLKQTAPWFILGEVAVCFFLWFIFAISNGGGDFLQTLAGIDSIFPQKTELRLTYKDCEDLRWEVWRWLTYQWTHVGSGHVCMNIILCIIMGIPLEGIHGWWRMILMFNVGVLGGALCYGVSDAHNVVVGCSGGCYALIAMHFADLIINWSQKKFRFPTLAFLVLLVGIDILNAVITNPENLSHAAHIGGFIAGLCIGILVGRNEKILRCERVIQAFVLLLFLGLIGFSIGFLAAQEAPRSMFEAAEGTPGWCWVRQVYNVEITRARYVCIRCGNEECINDWKDEEFIHHASARSCKKFGWHVDDR